MIFLIFLGVFYCVEEKILLEKKEKIYDNIVIIQEGLKRSLV